MVSLIIVIQTVFLLRQVTAQKNNGTLAPEKDRACEVYDVSAYTDASCRYLNTQFGPFWAGTITAINDLLQSGSCLPISEGQPRLHARCRSSSSISFTFYENDDVNCSTPIPPPGIRQENNPVSVRTFYGPFTADHSSCYQSTVDYSQYTVLIRNFIKYPGGNDDGRLYFNLTSSEMDVLKQVEDAHEIDESVALMLQQDGVGEARRNEIENILQEFGEEFYLEPEKFGQSLRIQLTAPNGDITQEELKNITLGIQKGLKLFLSYQRIKNFDGSVSDKANEKADEFRDFAKGKLDEIDGSSVGLIIGIIIALFVISGIVAFVVFKKRQRDKKVAIGTHEVPNN